MRVEPLGDVELFDEIADGVLGASSRRGALVVDELGAQRGEEALGYGVVPAVASPAHARGHRVHGARAAAVVAGVRAAAIGVVHNPAEMTRRAATARRRAASARSVS